MGCETWLNNKIEDSMISNYTIIRKDRNNVGGGVILGFSPQYKVLHKSDFESDKIEGV